MYYPFVRKALFQLDPERAHEFTFQSLRRVTGTPFEALVRQKVPSKPVSCMGLTFKNPLGLAAGLDKNGECIDALGAMGFGSNRNRYRHAAPTAGNDKPRIFRLVDAERVDQPYGL
jgi:Dihydroorotate dehydrogenase